MSRFVAGMFIISKGWGILGLLPLVVAMINFDAAARWGFQHRGSGPETGVGMMVIAAGIWWLGRRLNRNAARLREVRHSMFMIPLQYYALPLFAAGSLLAVGTLLAPP